MGIFGTSNNTLATQINTMGQSNFKMTNNLLTLQENHVEEFFQYHGEPFLQALDKLIEDIVERVVSDLLTKLKFVSNTNGDLEIHSDSLVQYNSITQENIDLDIVNLLSTAVNSEVIMQRRMAKQQYLESQGFASSTGTTTAPQVGQINPQGMNPANIQGGNMATNMNNTMMQQQMAMNNGTGYPVPPAGYDMNNNAYWIDPATGQPTYTPPQSGLGLTSAIQKGVAWAKWLA
jgi:hypothetical protein|tara:strand:- start:1983 stop:2681 length:699 start_codon:yes stop_codon:yes gene_type:complete